MLAARAPRPNKNSVRLLVVSGEELQDSSVECLPDQLNPDDLLVVNDAATLPASIHGTDVDGNPIEIRLTVRLSNRTWRAVVLGAGDWRIPTEIRPAPPRLKPGDRIAFADDFSGTVRAQNGPSERLIDLEFNSGEEDFWRSIYR